MSQLFLFTRVRVVLGLLLVVVTATGSAFLVTRDNDNSFHRRLTTTTQKVLRGGATTKDREVYAYSSDKKSKRKQQQDGSKSKLQGEEEQVINESVSTVDQRTPSRPRSAVIESFVAAENGSSHTLETQQTPANNDEGGRRDVFAAGRAGEVRSSQNNNTATSKEKRTRNKGNTMKDENKNNGEDEQVRKAAVDVDVYRRQLPKISVSFRMEGETNHQQHNQQRQQRQQRHTPIMVDYTELSQLVEEFVRHFFRAILAERHQAVQVHHKGVHVVVSVNEDHPFVVDFVVTLAFVIPGHVPTVKFLSDRLQEGLQQQQFGRDDNDDEGEGERDTTTSSSSSSAATATATATTTTGTFFVSELRNTMSPTNPFSNTVSIEVVRRNSSSSNSRPGVRSGSGASVSDTELAAGGAASSGSSRTRSSSRRFSSRLTTTELCKHILIASVLAGIGCLILIATTMKFLYEKKKERYHGEDTMSITTTTTRTTTRSSILSDDDDHSTTTTTDQTCTALAFTDDDDELS